MWDIYVLVSSLEHYSISMVFGFVPNRSFICIGSSLIAWFSFVHIKASGVVFFLKRVLFSWFDYLIEFQCFFVHYLVP